MPNAAVVVIGDVGHSPRTANHALSLAEEKGYNVYLIGYAESVLNERIANHERIKVVPIPAPPVLPLPELVNLVWRFAWTAIVLFLTLIFRCGWSLNIVLVQNPPALPALIVAWMACFVRDARFVIDWHNYTWSMLAERWHVGEKQLGVEMWEDSEELKAEKKMKRVGGGRASYIRLTHWLEGRMGRAADSALCVSAAMAADLKRRWGVEATVFYDRPPVWKFSPSVSLESKHSLFVRLAEAAEREGDLDAVITLRAGIKEEGGDRDDTFFSTQKRGGDVKLRIERPMIIVSSTSWTPDEDFSILLRAIEQYERRMKEEGEGLFPHLFLIITGKGPEKAYYMQKIRELRLPHVSFYSPWLDAADYPTAIASADLGVCLHTSTSGLDLPMKVVDMFGCGVPVLAKKFPAIGELVEEGVNGHLFDTSDDLAELLVKMARRHPDKNEALHRLQQHVRSPAGRLSSWEETWKMTTMETFRDEKEEIFRLVTSE